MPSTASWFLAEGEGGAGEQLSNPAIRGIVVNQAWVGAGIPYAGMPFTSPMYVVGDEQADLWRKDASNPIIAEVMNVEPTFDDAMEAAQHRGGTDKCIVFDGSYGRLTVSPSMAEYLKARAPEVDRRVEEELLPMWLRQRGLEGVGS